MTEITPGQDPCQHQRVAEVRTFGEPDTTRHCGDCGVTVEGCSLHGHRWVSVVGDEEWTCPHCGATKPVAKLSLAQRARLLFA